MQGTHVKIMNVENNETNIYMLVDTGSPVNVIKVALINKLFSKETTLSSTSDQFFYANDMKVGILGKFNVKLRLEEIPDMDLNVCFYVITDNNFKSDILLGRQLLTDSNLILVHDPVFFSRIMMEENNIFAIEWFEENEEKSLKIHTDLTGDQRIILENLLEEIERMSIQEIDDNYCVRVHLKEQSLYQYNPRRLSYTERKEIREIIDDLLERKIIKPSISPYSARIVPVRKKDGRLRLCADLRPLNHHVHRQKYPFPIIEDYLTRLANKKVFTLLELKDGFHQIRVHPDDTKYFSFTTPDGKYEYLRLPFGYSEAPAEF